MSDWDLMMPGMGLSAIGLAGVILSYMGIANTFLTGMQALSGLTLFLGLVFLSAGILSGGVSTSGRAKATTLVIFGIAGSVGTYALSLNTIVTTLPRFVGVLIIILIPTIVIAFASMKTPKYFRPIAIIFVLAMATGIVSYTTFGFIGPGAQFALHSTIENTTNSTIPTNPNIPIISVEIPANASVQGNPSFIPNTISVPKGYFVQWINNDKVPHTITSAPNGSFFDSNILSPGKTFRLDTSKLDIKEYNYLCTVHPFMVGKIIITTPSKPVFANVTIRNGAGASANADCISANNCYSPNPQNVKPGATIKWVNNDTVSHTVTSGKSSDNNPGLIFDSGLIKPGKDFAFTFNDSGTYDYFCSVHPWMNGKVTVG